MFRCSSFHLSCPDPGNSRKEELLTSGATLATKKTVQTNIWMNTCRYHRSQFDDKARKMTEKHAGQGKAAKAVKEDAEGGEGSEEAGGERGEGEKGKVGKEGKRCTEEEKEKRKKLKI